MPTSAQQAEPAVTPALVAARDIPARHGPAAVSALKVSKAFQLPHRQYHTLKERALHPFHSRTFDVLQAVDDVSVEIPEGEFFGIVGRNGSGKSTLLKCLAGIYGIDSGELRVRGRLSPFIELGVGFNTDLTARDNVMINAIMLGLTRRQARERFDEIIAFAELEDFLDLKLKNYSSGMQVRLAFAVAIQVDAEILLIDEVLAVGDAAFQQKCFDEFHRLKKAGRTIIFVTHDMSSVQRFCNRAMLLEKGRMIELGDPATIARRYNELNFGRAVHQVEQPVRANAASRREADIVDGWFEDPDGVRIAAVAHGEPCCACLEVHFNEMLTDPIFGITLRNDVGHTVFATTTALDHGPTGTFRADENAVVRMRFENWLTPSRYSLTPSVAQNGRGDNAIDLREDVATLLVHGGHFTGGVANFPHGFEIGHR
ncbi:MAG TPA: ABC transporter ATP-binding protein [Solirubrobacteraceae bacterium]|nr:ABC transporter ATP-binding protein [Solirubrobacteraceae bacterium]